MSSNQPPTIAYSRNVSAAPLEVILPDGNSPIPLGSGTIVALLGEGGASIVYEIWNEQLGVKRAVKLLRPNTLPTWRERFSTEIRITAQLRHPNIIEIHSVGEWNHLPYIEMERLDGCSLDKLLSQRGALPLRVMLAISIMVCRALAYTHEHTYTVNGQTVRGILHRDLKPANILIAETGVVKLMDFGLATPVNISMHTIEGTVVGSLPYMPPEMLEGKKATRSADLYAFGAVMYEMLTGVPAFAETNMADFMAKRMRNDYRPLREFRRRLPARLVKIINRCMAFDSEKRVSDASHVCAELERIYAQYTDMRPEDTVRAFLTNTTPKRTLALRRRMPLLIPMLGVFTTAIFAALLGYAALGRRSAPTTTSATSTPAAPTPVQTPRESTDVQASAAASVVAAEPQRQHPPAVRKHLQSDPSSKPTTRTSMTADSVEAAPHQLKTQTAETSPIALLAARYGTADPMALLAVTVRERDFRSALHVYDSLPLGVKKSPQAVLCKMRALEGLGERATLGTFARQNPISDAEYFLILARNAYDQQRYRDALAMLEQSRASNAAFADQSAVNREVLYYRALCLTAQYESAATEQNRTAATDAWIEVKYALRNDQTHRYFAAANQNLRRLNPEEGESR